MQKIVFYALALFMVSCNQPKPSQNTAPIKEEPAPEALFTAEKVRDFSTTGVRDTFRLTVTGTDLLHARVSFRIISGSGRTIYSDDFDSNYLIGFGIYERADSTGKITDSIRTAYIKDRLKHFLDDENFHTPAITTDAAFEPQHTSRDLFEELKSKPDAVSFYYLLGKEDGRYIAWSERSGKVLMFYNCC